jgi:hypothetical protein
MNTICETSLLLQTLEMFACYRVRMATSGRKPKPIEQKVRLGNPGQRKLPALSAVTPLPQNVTEIPEPHRPLMNTKNGGAGAGRQLWNMIWQSGSPWIRQETDIEIVMLVCEQTDERMLLRDKMFRTGLEWRERAGLRQLEKHIAQNLAQLGFTPTDRARLGVSGIKTDGLQEFRDRIAEKRTTA